HSTVRGDEDRVDVVEAVVDFERALRAEPERGLRQAVGARRRRPDDRRAAHLARRVSRAGVDDVVVAHAVFVEIALVVARRGDRGVLQRNARDHFLLAIRVTDADDPWLAEAIADDAAVAAGSDQRVLDAASLQDRYA